MGQQIRAILLLPGTVMVVIPATILYFTGMHDRGTSS